MEERIKELDLYKFIKEHNIEYHWHGDDVIVFIHLFQIEEFAKMIPSGLFDDNGIECHLKDGYMAIMMDSICNYCDIELIRAFPDKDN
jgi:hypothetical protein